MAWSTTAPLCRSPIHGSKDTASSASDLLDSRRAPSATKPRVHARRTGPVEGMAAAECSVQPWWMLASPGQMLPVPKDPIAKYVSVFQPRAIWIKLQASDPVSAGQVLVQIPVEVQGKISVAANCVDQGRSSCWNRRQWKPNSEKA